MLKQLVYIVTDVLYRVKWRHDVDVVTLTFSRLMTYMYVVPHR